MDTYKIKYLKYKKKYLNLKKIQSGGERKSPTQSATLYKVGTKKKGNDGNTWIVVMNKNRVKRWKLYKKKQRLVKGAFNRLSPRIKKENKDIVQKLDKIANYVDKLENRDAEEEAFEKLSLQHALDNIDSPNYNWIKNDPHTIQKAIKYGLRVPEYLLNKL